ncbi:30S ribosomal protein S3 [Candidatus Microgenomates bacterium]|nr:30S ribosomal protein S3 [Candidatus Microgenomates bacterium]
MGQKVNPTSMRLQVLKDWRSRWFANKAEYKRFLAEDLKIRRLIDTKLDRRVGIDHVDIERSPNMVTVTIHTARPGMIIGRGGAGIDDLKNQLQKITAVPIKLTIEEIKKPELRAQLVADNIAAQLERRIAFRRAIKLTADNSLQAGAKGIKIVVSGRLGGIEMARTEKEIGGSIPLHTLRADIDYGQATAHTGAGLIGVKVWVYKGEAE